MTKNEYGDDLEDDDIPWADPQIQKDYEAALGGFLVRFNRIENMITTLMRRALERLERTDLLKHYGGGQLKQRMQHLELILLAFPEFPKVPAAEIEKLAASRNSLAHGHFEQNPFDGEYEIIGKGEPKVWTPAEIVKEAEVADDLWKRLRLLEAHFIFFDVPELPKDASPVPLAGDTGKQHPIGCCLVHLEHRIEKLNRRIPFGSGL